MNPFSLRRVITGLLGALLFPISVISAIAGGEIGPNIYYVRRVLGPFDNEVFGNAKMAYIDGGKSAYLFSLILSLAVAGYILATVLSYLVTLILTILSPKITLRLRALLTTVLIFLLFFFWIFSSNAYQGFCTQAFTPGRNILTNECETFSTGCLSSGYIYDKACYTEDYLK